MYYIILYIIFLPRIMMTKRLPRPAEVGEAVRGLILKLILCKKNIQPFHEKKSFQEDPPFLF